MISNKVSRKIEFGLWCGEHRLLIDTDTLGKVARWSPWQADEDGEKVYFYYLEPQPEPVTETEDALESVEIAEENVEDSEQVEAEPAEPVYLLLENLILGLHPSATVVHVNGDCLDFRKANLRVV
jgi:hypothetical protein